MKELEREVLLSFWKIHILHHSSEEPLHGQWMVTELRKNGYEISPGTLYPITFLGCSINLLGVPARALAGNWQAAGALILAERIGRALRKPTVEAMQSK
jgi:hypothetical protein